MHTTLLIYSEQFSLILKKKEIISQTKEANKIKRHWQLGPLASSLRENSFSVCCVKIIFNLGEANELFGKIHFICKEANNLKISFFSYFFPRKANFASKLFKVQCLKYLVVLTILAIKFKNFLKCRLLFVTHT